MPVPRRVIVLMLVALSAVALLACDKRTSITTLRSLQDGARIDKSWSRTWKDRAEFRCIASTSGRCNIVVFVSVCAGASCNTQLVKQLALLASASQSLTSLPRGFRHCVAHAAKPVVPTCLKA